MDMFNKNRANLARRIFELVLKMSFPLKLNLIIGVTYLRVNLIEININLIESLIISPEIIKNYVKRNY